MLSSVESHAPKYAQLADIFRQRVARGQWPRDSRLPTNEQLATEFGVSRITVRQALDILADEGILEAKQGRGTYVKDAPPQQRQLPVETTLAALDRLYRDTSPEILTINESSVQPALTAADGQPAAEYVYMRRLHSRDGQPYCLISIYMDKAIFRKHAARFRREVVIPILVSMKDPKIARARQTLTVGASDLEASNLLKIPLNSPVAEVRRVFNAADGRVIYVAEVTYRGDFVRIEMDLKP